MIVGETVVVYRETQTGEDAHGEPITETTGETVEDVLVAPGPLSDSSDVYRPDGTVVAFNLHFPKTFTGSLRGATIAIRGGIPCKVIGDPHPYTLENTPTRWHMPVEVERADG